MQRMTTYRLVIITFVAAALLMPAVESAFGQQAVFAKVKARSNRSDIDRRLVDKEADLVFDDRARKLTVRSAAFPLDIAYDSVEAITFEVTTHMRGGIMSELFTEGISGMPSVNDYWFLITYRTSLGGMKAYLLEVSRDSSKAMMDKAVAVFGDKVKIASFLEVSDSVDKDGLPDVKSKHDLKIDKNQHPIPEIRPDKALVVVVCPPVAARYSGKGNQVKVHANDRVIAVNTLGTYSFAYLDPGNYRLASQSENANGMQITLEAGRDYYFLQDTLTGFLKARTALTRHTKELVLYELNGAYYANWTRKK